MPGSVRESLVERIREIAERAAAREGIALWDVEVAGSGRARVVRIYIDRPTGVTHSDCELMSQQVGTVLDVEDVIPGESYHLEISSPGVERKLLRPEHYRLCTGQAARLSLREPLEGQKRLEGTITGVEEASVLLDSGGGPQRIPFDRIEKANLKFEW